MPRLRGRPAAGLWDVHRLCGHGLAIFFKRQQPRTEESGGGPSMHPQAGVDGLFFSGDGIVSHELALPLERPRLGR